jgi:hypothetical protein
MLLSNGVVSRVTTNYLKESKEKCGIEQNDAGGVEECSEGTIWIFAPLCRGSARLLRRSKFKEVPTTLCKNTSLRRVVYDWVKRTSYFWKEKKTLCRSDMA